MTRPPHSFTAAYASFFRQHLERGDEATLRVAYELGRDGVRRGLSVLDLAEVHHDVLIEAVAHAPDNEEVQHRVRAAGAFFLETLSAFDMVQRGLREVRDAAALERRQAELLRRLSAFLADASLALAAEDWLEEVLQLVAEHGRELVGARACLAEARAAGERREAWAATESGEDVDADSGRGGCEPPEEGARGRISARLCRLDGVQIGSIEAFAEHGEEFSSVDEATLAHLAEMASAAIERAAAYPPRG